jgi:4-amino-4-deoxy-L-arabinose transferase-like glycosyltransferase
MQDVELRNCFLNDSSRSCTAWAVLFVTAAALLSFVRFHVPLQEPQESRYAEIPRQMLAEGNWLVPVLHGEPYLDKPPLLYWLVMASYSVFGVHDWAARLIPCTATFLTLCTAYVWGRRVLGARGGFLAGMLLALSARFIYLNRLLTMDSLLCLWVTAALAGAHLTIIGDRFRWRPWLLSAFAAGLGLLTKGPVALVLVVSPIFLMRFLNRTMQRPGLAAWAAYGGIAFAIAAPWYLAVLASDPEFADYFFWKHNFERFVMPFDHQEPFWFFGPELLLAMLPWTLLLPGMLISLCRRKEVRAEPVFLLTPACWCILFFSLSGCKRPSYILPAIPPLALALGCYLDLRIPTAENIGLMLRCHTSNALPASWLLCGGLTFIALLIGTYLFLPGQARHFSMRGQVRPLADVAAEESMRVACYPRGWDSVNFYLKRDDVKVYGLVEQRALIKDLSAASRTLLFVRTEKVLNELLTELPADLQYRPQGRQGTVRVGFVTRLEGNGEQAEQERGRFRARRSPTLAGYGHRQRRSLIEAVPSECFRPVLVSEPVRPSHRIEMPEFLCFP